MFRRLRKRIKAWLFRLRVHVRSVVGAPLFAWFIAHVYLPYLYTAHLKSWPAIKATRIALRRKPKPFPCCRREDLRGPRFPIEGADLNLTGTRCGTCGRRHLLLVVDPGSLGVTFGGV